MRKLNLSLMFMLPLFLSAMHQDKQQAVQDIDTMFEKGEITRQEHEFMMKELLDGQSTKAEYGSQSNPSQIAADAAEKRMPKWLKPQTEPAKTSPVLDPVEQLKAKKTEIINAIDDLLQSGTQFNMNRVQKGLGEFYQIFTAKYQDRKDDQNLTTISSLVKLDTIDISNFGLAFMQIQELKDSNALDALI